MNPVVFVHLFAGLLLIAVSRPFIQRKVTSNPWFGVRIPAAFESEEAWFAINEYGGRLLRRLGVVIAVTAVIGAVLGSRYWFAYDCSSLAVVMGGLAVVLIKIFQYGRTRKKPDQAPGLAITPGPSSP